MCTHILHNTNKASTVLLSSIGSSLIGCGLGLPTQNLFIYKKDDSTFTAVRPRSCAMETAIFVHTDRNGFSLLWECGLVVDQYCDMVRPNEEGRIDIRN